MEGLACPSRTFHEKASSDQQVRLGGTAPFLRVDPASIRTLSEPGWLGACWGPLGGCCNLRSGLEARCSRRSHPDAVFGAHLLVGTLAKQFPGRGWWAVGFS